MPILPTAPVPDGNFLQTASGEFARLPPLHAIVPMNCHDPRVRRATVDDLAQLRALWQSLTLPVADLEKRVTEFQVAESPDGTVAGAVGLQMLEGHGLIHSEVFADFAIADQLRPLLWDRLHAVALNHGLFRLWTCEPAPFWRHCGLVLATPELLSKLPAPWRGKQPNWLTLQLREETSPALSVEREFALFMETEKQRTQAALDQARALKIIATVLAILLLGAVIAGGVYYLRQNPLRLGP
jgi:N-acetylglutamate synthase-like GNAT family acetyltransferase